MMTSPTTTQQPPQSGLSATQLAALLALVQAQSAMRLQLTRTAVAGVLAAFDNLSDWWNPAAINRAISDALKIVQPAQLQAARTTDAYLTQALSIMNGSPAAPVGNVDITRLRRAMPDRLARELADGHRQPGYLVIGDTATGGHDTLNDPVPLTLRDVPKQQVEYAAPSDPYGRVADQYRFDVVAKGLPEEQALEKAKVRLAVAASTDVTLAVRDMYEKGLKRKEVKAWRRIVHPELSQTGPCGLCVVAADRIYSREDLHPIHDRCVCEVLPIVVKAGQEYDPGYQLDREQLDALYAAAGGTGGNPLRQEGRLKNIRVAIAEHAELGAVLVNADQNYRGPVEVARKQVGKKEPVKDLSHQLNVWEQTYEKLLVRAAQGEDVERPMTYQRMRIGQLRRDLGLPQVDLPLALAAA